MPAISIDQLPNKVFITVKAKSNNVYTVYYSNKWGQMHKLADGRALGYIEFIKSFTKAPYKQIPAENVYEVQYVHADKGYGPLLYDVAIELATVLGNGQGMLKPDSFKVTEEATNIWLYYLNNRSDVKKTQLDNEHNELTPQLSDNTQQGSSRRDPRVDHWSKSVYSKGYSKECNLLNSPKIINLIKENKIQYLKIIL